MKIYNWKHYILSISVLIVETQIKIDQVLMYKIKALNSIGFMIPKYTQYYYTNLLIKETFNLQKIRTKKKVVKFS